MSPLHNSPTSRTGPPVSLGRWWLSALLLSALLAAAVSIAGLSGGAPTDILRSTAAASAARQAAAKPVAAKTTSVMIMNYTYSPAALTVSVGDTVTWTNMDTAPHTVTVTSGPVKFNSGNLQKGESFSYTFTKAGTYQYYCAVHPDMKASVSVVGDEPTPDPTPTPTPTPEPTPEPKPTPTPAPTHPMPSPGESCGGLQAAVDAFLLHFYAAHLETSPGQQAADALSLDQYLKTHLVLVRAMLEPTVDGGSAALGVFLDHVYAAHLESSPGEQVADAAALDQYVKTHTVMIEDMVKPLGGADLSSC